MKYSSKIRCAWATLMRSWNYSKFELEGKGQTKKQENGTWDRD